MSEDTSYSIYNNEKVLDKYKSMLILNADSTRSMVKLILEMREDIKHDYYRIIDIGCGLSPMLQSFRDELEPNRIDYLGIDNSHQMIKEAKKTNHENTTTKIKYIQANVNGLYDLTEFPWYNIVIVQSFVHLLLNDDDIIKLCKFISKILPNDGVFYISSKTNVDYCKHLEKDIYLVEKNDGIVYRKRIFTEESFERLIIKTFKDEGTYEIKMFRYNDDMGNEFLNVIGKKTSIGLYEKYRYHFGYDRRLTTIKHILSQCTECKEYVDNPMSMITVRKEALLLNLYYTNNKLFLTIMGIITDIFSKILPGKYPVYMKDKLNLNQKNWRFKLHQDASAGWNKDKYESIVTIGIPMAPILSYLDGPTRIAIRQGYIPVITDTKPDKTIDEERMKEILGKPLQYLNCFGIDGNYYLFDQYVLHDSNFNLTSQSRDVWFVTCAVSSCRDDTMDISMSENFYKKKTVLDKKQIELLLEEGYTYDDFSVDVFGKVILARGKCNYLTLY